TNEGETPASMYDIINGYKPLIRVDDIVMTYYDLLRRKGPPDLYITINQVYRDMDNTLVVDKFEGPDDLQKAYDSWVIGIIQELDIDMRRLDTINDIQLRLAEVDQQPKLTFSPVSINSTIMSFAPTIDGRVVTPED